MGMKKKGHTSIFTFLSFLFFFLLGTTGRRRAATRVSYVNMINGEESSSLLTRLKIQEDLEERERRRIREKEKKEANLVLLQDLAEWEEKELDPDIVKQLHSMWEVTINNYYRDVAMMMCGFNNGARTRLRMPLCCEHDETT